MEMVRVQFLSLLRLIIFLILGSRRPRVDRAAATRFITQSIPVSAIIGTLDRIVNLSYFICTLWIIICCYFDICLHADDNHPRVQNAKKYLMKNKLLLESSTTNTNQTQPSKIVKRRLQSTALRGFGEEGGGGEGGGGGGGGGGFNVSKTLPLRQAFHQQQGQGANAMPTRASAAAQRQKKTIARIAQQQHQRRPRNNNNTNNNSNSLGDGSEASVDGSRPRFVKNNQQQQQYQQSRGGPARNQENAKFQWKKKIANDNNTNEFADQGENGGGGGRPKFVGNNKGTMRPSGYANANEVVEGSVGTVRPKFVMNKQRQLQFSSNAYSDGYGEVETAPQKYIPKHLRNQQQQQELQQQQFPRNGMKKSFPVPPNQKQQQQPILMKRAPFVPKAYQNMNFDNQPQQQQSTHVKAKLNSSSRSLPMLPNLVAPRPISSTINAKTAAQNVKAKQQSQQRSKRSDSVVGSGVKSASKALVSSSKSSSSNQNRGSGSELIGLGLVHDFRSTFGFTDVHWTGK
jgi:hypothetical protein